MGEWFIALSTDTRLNPNTNSYKTGEEWNAAVGGATRNIYYKRLVATTNQDAESIGVSVSWYGGECCLLYTSDAADE